MAITPEAQALIDTYQKAQIKLLDIIAKTEAKGNSTLYRKRVLEGVIAELTVLNKYAGQWAIKEIPKAYRQGFNDSLKDFRQVNIETAKVSVNAKAINNLVNNAKGQLIDANNFVGRRISDDIRQAGLEAVKEKLSVGDTVKQTKANLLEKLTDKGIVAIRDKNGREIKLDSYASMVARTTTAEATNKASMQAVQDLGYDLVQITQHFSSCPICAVYEGRVYSISGKSKDYPPLSEAFRGGYSTIHVNCTHRAVPYFPQYDKNADELKKSSNKPFTVDDRSKASIDAYNKRQAANTARRNDRNEWEEAKLLAPDETPKTFSGFRAVKRADSKIYKAIKNKL